MSIILYATAQTSSELVAIGPETLLLGLSAALIAGMTSFPKAVAGAIGVGLLYQVLVFNFPNETGLVQFVLFIIVLVLVARMSRADDAGGESFAFAPRVPAVPERLREIWWVRRMPHVVAGIGLLAALVLPLLRHQSASQLTYSMILAFAICAVSVTVLTGWGGQLSLGQMAFAGIGALSAAAFSRGVTVNIGWRSHRIFNGAIQPLNLVMTVGLIVVAVVVASMARRRRWRSRQRAIAIVVVVAALGLLPLFIGHTIGPTVRPLPFVLDILLGALMACLLAVLVGTGALRVKGLLLAISTLAFAIAAESYIFGRSIFTGSEGALTVSFPRGKLAGVDLAHLNRNYYYFVLLCLVIVLAIAGHLRRTGIGRAIIGVRENEPAAAALTVSPTRAKLTAFALGGFISGLGGALLGGLVVTIGYSERFFTVSDSINLVAIAVIGGLGSLAGAVTGALWVIGLPAFWHGDAGHSVHPIAGQGLNMGLKDVAALAEVLIDAARLGEDLGSEGVLERYARWRGVDNLAVTLATDAFTRLFSNDNPALRAARGIGLRAVNAVGPARRFFMAEAGGATGDLPRLMRGETA